jgi:hypothetical protein
MFLSNTTPVLKSILALILLALGPMLYAQPGKPSVKNVVTVDKVPSAASIGTEQLVLPPDSSLSIGADFPLVSGQQAQNAACKDGKTEWMQYGKARIAGDTIVVALYRPERAYVHVLQIKIWKNEFLTAYHILARNELSVVKILPTDQVLVLEKLDYKRGETITGYVNFRGTRWESPDRPWESKMDWVESNHTVRGPFKIVID